MKKRAIAALLLATILLGSAPARAFPSIDIAKLGGGDVQLVSGNGHGRHDNHQSHGRDDFYEDNSQLGILFFWFSTGQSFGQQQDRVNANAVWCAERYRSYRPSDNTFQPNHGPRRQCVSPYLD